MPQVSVGAVTFERLVLGELDGPADLMGPPRVKALRAFYRREDLGNLAPVTGPPRRSLTWADVNWDTAGPRVTGTSREL